MVHRLSTALLLAFVVSVAVLADDDAQKDLDMLQGTWTLTAMEMNGEAAPKDLMEKLTVTFNGDRMQIDGPMAAAAGEVPVKPAFAVKLNPSETPKTLDAIALNGKFQGKNLLGIYHLDGDQLRICLPNRDAKARPKEFKAPAGSDLGVMTLARSSK